MQIKQKLFLKGKREVSVIDNDKIRIKIRERGYESEFITHLASIDISPVKTKRKEISTLIAGGFFSMVVLALLVSFSFATTEDAKIFLGIFSLLFGFATICLLYKLWATSYDLDIFYDRNTGNPVFNLFRNKPNQEAYNDFINGMTNAVRKTQINTEDERYYLMVNELEYKNIITTSEGDKIRKRIADSYKKEKDFKVVEFNKKE